MQLAGVDVARIGLGTNRLTNTPENRAFIREAVAAGIGMIDTAHTYSGGDSETTIGAALADEARDGSFVVATKGGYNGAAPDVLRREIDASLRRLRTDAIDLYYLHKVDPQTPLEESLAVIAEAREAGKIRAVGVSNVTVEQIERARGVVPIAAVQNHYSLTHRSGEDVVDYCTDERIVFVPYFPLRGGGAPAQIALAWLLQRSPMTFPIPGTLSIDHVRENLGALDIRLSDRDFEALA